MEILQKDDERIMVRLDVVPMAAPRQTQSDRWKRGRDTRPEVARYHTFKDKLWYEWKAAKLDFPPAGAVLGFFIPVFRSYSSNRRNSLIGKPHQGKKDGAYALDKDNLEKAFFDAIFPEPRYDDSHIWHTTSYKIWCDVGEGCIVVTIPIHTDPCLSREPYSLGLSP